MKELFRRFQARRFWLFSAVALAALLVVAGLELKSGIDREQTEFNRLESSNRVVLAQLVQQIDAICKTLGRTPKDQPELESKIGEPLPTLSVGNGSIRDISYERIDEVTYSLLYVDRRGIVKRYQSDQADAGWSPHPF